METRLADIKTRDLAFVSLLACCWAPLLLFATVEAAGYELSPNGVIVLLVSLTLGYFGTYIWCFLYWSSSRSRAGWGLLSQVFASVIIYLLSRPQIT